MELGPLLALAFDRAPARDAGAAIAAARARVGGRAFSYELLVPPAPDAGWLRAEIARLVYHCESRRAPLPGCAGVFLSLFVGESIYFVLAKDAVAWAGLLLDMTAAEMTAAFGTGEVRRPLALPGPRKD